MNLRISPLTIVEGNRGISGKISKGISRHFFFEESLKDILKEHPLNNPDYSPTGISGVVPERIHGKLLEGFLAEKKTQDIFLKESQEEFLKDFLARAAGGILE